MANTLANLAREYCNTIGTGSLVLIGAVDSAGIGKFNTLANAGITDGQTVTYCVEDTTGREIGQGVYTAATKTITRVVYSSTNGGAKLVLSGGSQVFITVAKEDLATYLQSASNLSDVANATTARGNLGCGTAAAQNIGTSGANVPLLNGNVTWSGTQAINNNLGVTESTDFGAPLTVTSTQGSANRGPNFNFVRASGSPAANDAGGAFLFQANDDALANQTFATIGVILTAVAAGAISSQIRFQTQVTGSFGARGFWGNGLVSGVPTGGDKGAGSINAQAVYDDSVLLTCPGVEFIKSGSVNTSTWDGFVPETVIPASEEAFPEHEDAEQVFISFAESEDGSLIEQKTTKRVKRQAVDLVPVFAEDGVTGIDMAVIPRHKIVKTPEQRIQRTHTVAHEFAAMVADGKFDPRDPKQYFDRLLQDEALPGMPNKANWQHGEKSAGRMITHLWLSLELLAGVVKTQQAQLDALQSGTSAQKSNS